MVEPFHDCDDIHDAASDVVRALNARLSRRGLQLVPEHWEPLRELIAAALSLVRVEGVEG
jgi:predicted nuclease with RNAse H fold